MPEAGDQRDQRKRSAFARIFAVLALAATVVGLIFVISSSTESGDGDRRGEQRDGGGGRSEQSQEQAEDGGRDQDLPKTYAVEPGDTLDGIAETFGLSVSEVEDLNPEVDPQALVTGQELKLR